MTARRPVFASRQCGGGPSPRLAAFQARRRRAAATELTPIPSNRLIDLLPPPDRALLLAHCALVTMHRGEVLAERDAPTRHVYFPLAGAVSLATRTDGHPVLEVSLVGHEGLVGVQVALGVLNNPLQAVVMLPGTAQRLEAAAFMQLLAASAALHACLQQHLYTRLLLLSASSGCLRFHAIGPRLARWLLMGQDRAGGDSFQVTHEALSQLLGVRRAGITLAALALQRDGLIAYRRGLLTVLDRPRLQAAACSCYAAGACLDR